MVGSRGRSGRVKGWDVWRSRDGVVGVGWWGSRGRGGRVGDGGGQEGRG